MKRSKSNNIAMSFWSSERIKERVPKEHLITPYIRERVAHGAYELSLGPEAYITSTDKKQKLEKGDQVIIPPGQFGLLLTEETIAVPADSIGFISMRAKWKLDGILNVSGFHVDPGFSGRLKFSVYNAGSRTIRIARGDPVFMIWYSYLEDITADVYTGRHQGQNEITSEDVNRMQGEVASPGALKVRLDEHDARLRELEERIRRRKDFWIAMWSALIGAIVGAILTITLEKTSDTVFPKEKKAQSEITNSMPAGQQVQTTNQAQTTP